MSEYLGYIWYPNRYMYTSYFSIKKNWVEQKTFKYFGEVLTSTQNMFDEK